MRRIIPRQFAVALFDITKEKTGKELKEAISSFLRFFLRHGRSTTPAALLRACEEYQKQEDQKETIAVQSDAPIQKKQREELAHLFPSKKISFANADPDILGGIRIEADDTIYDGTLKRTLERLSLSLTH